MLLGQEIAELQGGVVQMRQEALLKNVAKRKVKLMFSQVLYNLTGQGQLQLVYALLALAEHYQTNQLLNSCTRTLHEAQQLKQTGDGSYLLGVVHLKKKQQQQAIHWLEQCLKQEWIEPSTEHVTASKLQAMTQLQQLYFQTKQRQKLLNLSYLKIQQARENVALSEPHFEGLALMDMALVHEALGQRQLALEKIDGALSMLGDENPAKLIEAWTKRAQLLFGLGKPELVALNYTRAWEVVQRWPKCIDEDQQAHILEGIIDSHLNQ